MPCLAPGTSRGIALLILNFSDKAGWVNNTMPNTSPPEKDPQCPLYRGLGRPQGHYRQEWRKENLLPSAEFKTQMVQQLASVYTKYTIPNL
jgi:hypothetical protein